MFLTGKDDRNSVLQVMGLKPEGYLLKSMDKDRILSSIEEFFTLQKIARLTTWCCSCMDMFLPPANCRRYF
jgi:DNA-binding NarL/FixJ family response regulator